MARTMPYPVSSIVLFAALFCFMGLLVGCSGSAQQSGPSGDARAFIAEHESSIRPLEIALSRASWDANISGKDEDYRRKIEAQNRYDAALADRARFARLEGIHKALETSPDAADALVRRQIQVLRLQYLEKQLDPALLEAMTAKASAAEQAFNVYRAKVDGKELTQSEVLKVLKTSKDPALRQRVWEASKAVGPVVEKDLKDLVRLRNQAARKLGFANYHDMQLQLTELSTPQVTQLFDELYELTREPFRQAKARIDAKLAADYGITPADLRPWHYHDLFFQEAPAVYSADLDSIYAKADILKLCRDFYAGIGLPIDDVLKRSDLYEKPGKNPHASCWDIDRAGDVRVLANIVNDEYWMNTMLHELGHAVYDSTYIPASVPYVLRTPAHIFTTEGMAMLFERFSKRADWMAAMGLPVPDTAAVAAAGSGMTRDQLLLFAAWSQVMVRFEMAMYANPEQDLNKLWWDLAEKYQLLHRPEGRNAPDYAAKIHVVSSPAYYHNYMMGGLFSAQLHHAIARQVLRTEPSKALYNGHKEVGDFLKKRVFALGASVRWEEMVRQATGEPLSAKALAAELGAR